MARMKKEDKISPNGGDVIRSLCGSDQGSDQYFGVFNAMCFPAEVVLPV